MSRCVMAFYHPGWNKLVEYSCEYVKQSSEELKFRFRKTNGTEAIEKRGIKDKAYEEYCKQIDSFIAQCTCDMQTDNKAELGLSETVND